MLPVQLTVPALCSLTHQPLPFLFRGTLQVLQVAVLGWTLSCPCQSRNQRLKESPDPKPVEISGDFSTECSAVMEDIHLALW